MKQIVSILFMLLLGMPCMAQETQEHVVKIGEDFASIAEKYGITEKQLVDMNPKGRGVLFVGMKLKVPKVKPQAEATETVTVAAKGKKDKKSEAKSKKSSKKDAKSSADKKAEKEAAKAEKEAKKAEKAAARKAKLEERKAKKKKK